MKKLIAFLFILFLIISTFSCNKSDERCETIYQDGGSMGVSIKSTESFEYNLRFLEHKTDVSIIQQPNHFKISLVENDAANQVFKYKYHPASNYIGRDSVAFQSKDCSTKTKVNTKIYFSVTN